MLVFQKTPNGHCRLILIIVLLACLHTASGSVYETVQRKLSSFAAGSTAASDLTREELLALVEEYRKAPEARTGNGPEDRLMLHFVILPTLRLKRIIERKPEFFASYKSNVEKFYKKFKPAYNNEVIGNGLVAIKFNKIWLLSQKLEKDVGSLTLKDFQNAKNEAVSWQRRLLELVQYEDVFANEVELASILNLMNHIYYRPLFIQVLPQVTDQSDPQELAGLYFDTLWSQHKIKLLDGRWTKYVR